MARVNKFGVNWASMDREGGGGVSLRGADTPTMNRNDKYYYTKR